MVEVESDSVVPVHACATHAHTQSVPPMACVCVQGLLKSPVEVASGGPAHLLSEHVESFLFLNTYLHQVAFSVKCKTSTSISYVSFTSTLFTLSFDCEGRHPVLL